MVKVVDDEQDAANAERHAAASAGLKLGIVRLGRAGGKVRHGTRVNFYSAEIRASRRRDEKDLDQVPGKGARSCATWSASKDHDRSFCSWCAVNNWRSFP